MIQLDVGEIRTCGGHPGQLGAVDGRRTHGLHGARRLERDFREVGADLLPQWEKRHVDGVVEERYGAQGDAVRSDGVDETFVQMCFAAEM